MDITSSIESILLIDPVRATDKDRALLLPVWEALRTGTLRAAEREGTEWRVNMHVKKVIIWAFRSGVLVDIPDDGAGGVFSFTDKNTLPVQRFTAESARRIVPGGSTVRDGSYLAPGVIVMPPAYINGGCLVDEGTMVDSHALVGSCAQIGKNVHLSAAVQVGGVLEPIGAMPVIIEDNVMVGGNCGIYEGTIVRQRCVIGTGVILNASTPVYDLVRETIYRKTKDRPLEIPEGAVVVQGSRPAGGKFAAEKGVQLYTPVIVKYRDDKTDAATILEEALR
jgi:2,3,4,5-tetrahydropyridine-2,6-dicarboxylate N-succinyltransferase